MNISAGHFGVDVIAPKNEAVVAILKGTIVYQNWTPTDGHVVHIQHKNNLLSIYKHNSEVLKKIGLSLPDQLIKVSRKENIYPLGLNLLTIAESIHLSDLDED